MQKKKIEKIAKDVIQYEIESLKKLKNTISKSFLKLIKIILNCKDGKIIISGVGKSGIIGKKWSATLSSTGTPSFFFRCIKCKPRGYGSNNLWRCCYINQ